IRSAGRVHRRSRFQLVRSARALPAWRQRNRRQALCRCRAPVSGVGGVRKLLRRPLRARPGRRTGTGCRKMTLVADALGPSASDALSAGAARVRANREQVDRVREAAPADFYAPVAGMFRANPRRRDEPALEVLRTLVRPPDTILDIGAGGGRL